MKNRHGDVYTLNEIEPNVVSVEGDLNYWRYGGREGQQTVDLNDLGFADPSGGPFLHVGMKLGDRSVNRIRVVGEQLLMDLV